MGIHPRAGGSTAWTRATSSAKLAWPVAPTAWRPLLLLAGLVAAVLALASGRYGYHRDELYFLQAARHLAWGYPDQPPLTPLLARIVSTVAPDSLVALRLPSALAAAAVVVLTGLIARDLGGDRAAQLLAAACMGVSALLIAVSHLLSTSTFDLLAWTALSWMGVKVLRSENPRWWVLVGLTAGVGLLNKTLVAFLLAGLVGGIVLAGPAQVRRALLASGWVWLGAAIALALWAPHLLWQAQHGWPQLELSKAIAGGSSGSSQPPAVFVPFQLLLVSPLLAPVWIAGLWRLLRDPSLSRVRAFGVAYLMLTLLFLLTRGKPYYLGGLYPVLLAAGAPPTLQWVRRLGRGLRRTVVGGALGLSAVVSAVLMLPVVPVAALHATPVVDINYDAGETVGWPRLVETVAQVYQSLPAADRAQVTILTGNYGQAGAIDHFGPALGLPHAFSGHNGYGLWGPPPDGGAAVIAVGLSQERLQRFFGSVQLAARVDNGVALDNDEQGTPIWLCREQFRPWAQIWPELRHLN